MMDSWSRLCFAGIAYLVLCNKEYVKEKVKLHLYLARNKIDVACNQHFLIILSSQENTD